MSKEKQIEEMASFVCSSFHGHHDCENCSLYEERCCVSFGAAKRLYNAGYRKQEWISVEERLPSMDELCLLSMENRITKYRWVVIGYFHTNYDEYVTHWMPLPEAPKMRKEEEGK